MNKDCLKFVIVGHVDHGKSTLIGRLLYDTGSLPQDKINEIKKFSTELGRKTEFAFILDHLQEERSQGITIDTTQIFFSTPERDYVIIDAPGHVEFVKNMMTGASQADAAILIVSAKDGLQEQTKRHSYILKLLGITQIIVAINLWEDMLVTAAADFERVKEQVQKFLSSINIQPAFYIPIVATTGENIAKSSTIFNWYNGKGESILLGLKKFCKKANTLERPLYFSVQDVYRVAEKRITVGRVESGVLNVNTRIVVSPTGQKTTVKSIEKFNESSSQSALPGECIGITINDAVFIERGNVITNETTRPNILNTFEAIIFWTSKKPLAINEDLTIQCATQSVPARVSDIMERFDSSNFEPVSCQAACLQNLEGGRVIIKTKTPIVISKFSDLREYGRFIFLRDEDACAGGIIP